MYVTFLYLYILVSCLCVLKYCYLIDMTDTISISFSESHMSSSRIMDPKVRETEGYGEDSSGRIAPFLGE